MEVKHNHYGLTDASRSCYISVTSKLLSLGVSVRKLGPYIYLAQ